MSNKKSTDKKTTPSTEKVNNKKRILFSISAICMLTSIAFLLSFTSYFFTGEYDQTTIDSFNDREVTTENWLGKIGAYLSHTFIFKGFGIASFLFVKIFAAFGFWFADKMSTSKLRAWLFWDLFALFTLTISLGTFGKNYPYLGGVTGHEIYLFLEHYIGKIGTLFLVMFLVVFFLVFRIKLSPAKFTSIVDSSKEKINQTIATSKEIFKESQERMVKEGEIVAEKPSTTPQKVEQPFIVDTPAFDQVEFGPIETKVEEKEPISTSISIENTSVENTTPIIETDDFIVEQAVEEPVIEENLAAKLVEDFGEFDPTLDLANFKFPTPELLIEHSSGGITINQAELEENKNQIVKTLNNYKIGIDKIKATVGPTVTLYEIIPEAGVRISKIKSLEDDIALSLAALGIRIIAPIPGKGTIGIEVPNTQPTVVSMRSLITSPKFQNAEMELPIALGKTISNETFVVDLAKMPHLLMAGATGQGKSVGLNAVLTSLLYKKHPAEVKFVLVDPKKVELTLFNKIERHYLAKLPDTEDAIITDNTKVINTLNSLCIEMDNRYSLLKDAMVRNIKEYNQKFKQRKLNPNNGHRFLPYIVLVVDEFADLIMTAGKEVETPIARLAQLARAIGIHLIIATQRPSVNVITGIIKANFPARIAFRVSSKIDSRTILDGPGADQLIGRGDLLYTQGNDMIRVQCAFVDTPEVEKITEFIGSQKAYSDAYLLPEYVGEESGTALDIDISERDSLFREAAEIVVTNQQGSASLLQRKLKLGYNRAGRLIDQLEAAGIVGPFEGSKARTVNFTDLTSLQSFLDNE